METRACPTCYSAIAEDDAYTGTCPLCNSSISVSGNSSVWEAGWGDITENMPAPELVMQQGIHAHYSSIKTVIRPKTCNPKIGFEYGLYSFHTKIFKSTSPLVATFNEVKIDNRNLVYFTAITEGRSDFSCFRLDRLRGSIYYHSTKRNYPKLWFILDFGNHCTYEKINRGYDVDKLLEANYCNKEEFYAFQEEYFRRWYSRF